eukprot:Skav233751  [mRNA]  locus=scaffold1792:258064:264229:- [translate_table: standard]
MSDEWPEGKEIPLDSAVAEEDQEAAEREAIAASLRARPKPTQPREINVEEADFWENQYFPSGSAVTFTKVAGGEEKGLVAVLAKDVRISGTGVEFRAKFLGCEVPEERDSTSRSMKGGKRKFHLCRLKDGTCPRESEDMLHLQKLTWYPPGDFKAPWLNASARRAIQDGYKSFLADEEEERKKVAEPVEVGAASTVEQRLSALKARAGPRVSWADPLASTPSRGGGTHLQPPPAATLQSSWRFAAGFGGYGNPWSRSFRGKPDRRSFTMVNRRPPPRVLLAGRSQAERRRLRAGIRLRDYTISEKTRARYSSAVAKLLPFLECQPDLTQIDQVISEWIELEWVRGTPLCHIADALSGMHHFWPELKGRLREAWRLFKSWRRIETPTRAPPITAIIVRAFIGRAVLNNQLAFATLVAIGFHGLLRTGELLALQFRDLELNRTCGIISLRATKSGQRTNTLEAVAIRDPLTLQLLDTLCAVAGTSPGNPLWPHSGQAFRETFRKYCQFFRLCHLLFKPYSLRRGGATHLLQAGVPMEAILLKGRWKSVQVARLYLQDALALLPSLRIPPSDQPRLVQFSSQTPSTAFQP